MLEPFWNNECKTISNLLPIFVKHEEKEQPLNRTVGISNIHPLSKYLNIETLVSEKPCLMTTFFEEPVREGFSEKFKEIENRDEMMKKRRLELQRIWRKAKKGFTLTEEEKEYRKPLPKEKGREKLPPNSVIKVRMYPTPEQQHTLRCMFGTLRFLYNSVVIILRNEYERNKNIQVDEREYVSAEELCKKLVTDTQLEWMKNTPAWLRQQVIYEVFEAKKSAITLLTRGHCKKFYLGFRDKKRLKSETFDIMRNASHIIDDSLSVFPTFINGTIKLNVRKSQPIPRFDYEPKIQHDIRTNKWFLIVPTYVFKNVPIRKENEESGVCAIDPDIRSFLTIYDTKKLITIGNNEMKKSFHPLLNRISHIQSLIDKSKNFEEYERKEREEGIPNTARKLKAKTIRNMKKRMAKLRDRISNKIKDIHHRTSKFLCDNYNTILLPKFQVSELSQKLSRRINKDMYCQSHFKFRMMLSNKTQQYPQCHLIDESEEYTSKTCGNCGVLNGNLGSSKTFSCGSCGIVMDRDANAARNIFIKSTKGRDSF